MDRYVQSRLSRVPVPRAPGAQVQVVQVHINLEVIDIELDTVYTQSVSIGQGSVHTGLAEAL